MKKAFGLAFMLAAVCAAGLAEGAGRQEITETSMEVSTQGPTAAEMLAQQLDLHEALVRELPAGALNRKLAVHITDAEAGDLRLAMETKASPFKVGVVKSLGHPISFAGGRLSRSPEPFGGGTLQATEDGGFVWAVTVSSAGATGIRLHFDKTDLPADADLYIMNMAGQAFGPYQRQGPNGTGEFWSNTVSGDTAVVVLRHWGPQGAADLHRTSFRIEDVGHVGPGFPAGPTPSEQAFCSFNEACVENASCHNVAAANPAKSAVALMQWISGQFIFTCTGGLLADTVSTSEIPYFLTANHCLSSNSTAQNLETYFQFSISCNSTNCPAQTNPGGIQRLGATVKATGSAGDFTLLQLNQTPPAGSVFLGWNNTAIANTNNAALHRISHPAWAPQAYSAHHVDTSAPTCQGWPRGERIYSRDDVGATEGGSSGSPVVNGSSQVVGQLSGGCGFNVGDVCDNVSNATVDGALAFYYSSVAPFLDPGTGGCGASGSSCTSNGQCCSNKCTGPKNNKRCR
ncbi:MAG: trypsin-like peptidase domain-containing protein [Candidatus Polarisedimenticolia bacterium]